MWKLQVAIFINEYNYALITGIPIFIVLAFAYASKRPKIGFSLAVILLVCGIIIIEFPHPREIYIPCC